MDTGKLHASLRVHEGMSLTPYRCTAGHLTIGIGHNLDAGITIQQVYMLLGSDIDNCITELDRTVAGWRAHCSARQNVLIEMMFNLGAPRLLSFALMRQALELRDYDRAAAEMLDSRWHQQVGQRARTLADQMRTGEYQT